MSLRKDQKFPAFFFQCAGECLCQIHHALHTTQSLNNWYYQFSFALARIDALNHQIVCRSKTGLLIHPSCVLFHYLFLCVLKCLCKSRFLFHFHFCFIFNLHSPPNLVHPTNFCWRNFRKNQYYGYITALFWLTFLYRLMEY